MIKIPKKAFPLVIVSFFLAFNYFILKALKETLLVTAPNAGAEAIPFVKMWFLFPASLFFLGVFTWMATRVSFRFAFISIISFFLLTYALFTYACYPFSENLHLHGLADSMQQALPKGWNGLAAVVRYWSYSLFYVTAECWCTMIYSVVFWGYANAVTKLHDAKEVYPFLTLAGTLAALVAGPLAIFFTSDRFAAIFLNPFDFSLYSLTALVLLCGISALLTFSLYCPAVPELAEVNKENREPLLKAFISVFKSPYLMILALIGLTYNLVINLSDVVWKNEVLKLYPDPKDFTAYLSYFTIAVGLVSTAFTLFVSRPVLKKYGWTQTALITPFIAMSTGLLFFGALLLSGYRQIVVSASTVTFLGSMHICLSSGGKYTLFEPAKEMAFIPLSPSEKIHGKTAIDGVGTRFGKTGSSLIYQSLFAFIPTVSACAPIIAIIVFAGICVCIQCVLALGKRIELLQPTISQTHTT